MLLGSLAFYRFTDTLYFTIPPIFDCLNIYYRVVQKEDDEVGLLRIIYYLCIGGLTRSKQL